MGAHGGPIKNLHYWNQAYCCCCQWERWSWKINNRHQSCHRPTTTRPLGRSHGCRCIRSKSSHHDACYKWYRQRSKPNHSKGSIQHQMHSMGFMVEDEEPIIWRGQWLWVSSNNFSEYLWNLMYWSSIFLGTGDAQLTMIQAVPISSAVIVTTPQNKPYWMLFEV